MLSAIWGDAFVQAYRALWKTRTSKELRSVFLAVIDKGSTGLKAAMAGTPYA